MSPLRERSLRPKGLLPSFWGFFTIEKASMVQNDILAEQLQFNNESSQPGMGPTVPGLHTPPGIPPAAAPPSGT